MVFLTYGQVIHEFRLRKSLHVSLHVPILSIFIPGRQNVSTNSRLFLLSGCGQLFLLNDAEIRQRLQIC